MHGKWQNKQQNPGNVALQSTLFNYYTHLTLILEGREKFTDFRGKREILHFGTGEVVVPGS